MRRAVVAVILSVMTSTGMADDARTLDGLTTEQVSHLARLPLACIQQEFPNKIDHVMSGPADVRRPKDLHPAFYGCLDWHSSVHGHWMLVNLLRTRPDLPEAAKLRKALNATLTTKAIAREAEYFAAPLRQSYERTYGWAWLLQLAKELDGWNDPDAKRWATALRPLTKAIAERYLAFFPKQTYPIRTGVHANTAFGLALALDYARAAHDTALDALVVERATTYYAKDVDYPAAWEPGGEDFLSPALTEADLMRRVLGAEPFTKWLHGFLPHGLPPALASPAIVSDRTDPKLAHLDGLNLSRAWALRAVALALRPGDPLRVAFTTAAEVHAREGLAHVTTGDYMGEHWLASFAVYLLGTPRS